ncbi:MAG: hypothetical protein WA446_08095 [Steroidobacteraceae bacterium]
MRQEAFENVIARLGFLTTLLGSVALVSIIGKLLAKAERTALDSSLDLSELLVGTSKIGFTGSSVDRGAIAHARNPKIELDSIRSFRLDPAQVRFFAHG